MEQESTLGNTNFQMAIQISHKNPLKTSYFWPKTPVLALLTHFLRKIFGNFGDMKIREKRNFFVNRSVPENFQWENFLGQVPTESLRTQDSENVYERWVQQIFDPVLPARSWEMPVKCELPAKIGRCSKKPPGRNFDFRAKSS